MKRILVVEDEYGISEAVRMLLEVRGYRVRLAGNGLDALAQIALETPELIVTDFMMPLCTGAELGRELKSRPTLATIPIIMTSSADEARVRSEFNRYDRFLRKPYSGRNLLQAVADLIGSPGSNDPG